jgi:hypothetical protein
MRFSLALSEKKLAAAATGLTWRAPMRFAPGRLLRYTANLPMAA